VEES